jgi:hypothetical protein
MASKKFKIHQKHKNNYFNDYLDDTSEEDGEQDINILDSFKLMSENNFSEDSEIKIERRIEIENLQKEIKENYEEKINSLNQDQNDLLNIIVLKNNIITEYEKITPILGEENIKLKTENKEYDDLLTIADENYEKLKITKTELEQKNEELQNNNNNLNSEKKAINIKYKKLEIENLKLTEKDGAKDKTIQYLKDENTKYFQEIKQIRKDNENNLKQVIEDEREIFAGIIVQNQEENAKREERIYEQFNNALDAQNTFYQNIIKTQNEFYRQLSEQFQETLDTILNSNQYRNNTNPSNTNPPITTPTETEENTTQTVEQKIKEIYKKNKKIYEKAIEFQPTA